MRIKIGPLEILDVTVEDVRLLLNSELPPSNRLLPAATPIPIQVSHAMPFTRRTRRRHTKQRHLVTVESNGEPVESSTAIAEEAPAPNEARNMNVAPLSAEGIRIGRTLNDPFSAVDLQARLDGDRGRSYTWIAAWKRKDWIETVCFGQYRKTKSFGEE